MLAVVVVVLDLKQQKQVRDDVVDVLPSADFPRLNHKQKPQLFLEVKEKQEHREQVDAVVVVVVEFVAVSFYGDEEVKQEGNNLRKKKRRKKKEVV